MDSEELRSHLLECLDTFPSTQSLQLISLINAVIDKLKKKGHYGNKWSDDNRGRFRGPAFDEDRERLRGLIWEFIVQGILIPGRDDTAQYGLPFLTLTDYGKKVVSVRTIQPYDPDGFLSSLKTEIPNIDSEIERYITESLLAFRRGLLLSAAVTMGVASEKAFILLHEELTNSLTDPTKKMYFQDLQSNYRTKHKFDEVKSEIMSHKSRYPRNIAENLETHLDTIYQVIRVTRNEIGHPTGKTLSRSEVYVRLQLFVEYTKIVYQLINWLQTNSL